MIPKAIVNVDSDTCELQSMFRLDNTVPSPGLYQAVVTVEIEALSPMLAIRERNPELRAGGSGWPYMTVKFNRLGVKIHRKGPWVVRPATPKVTEWVDCRDPLGWACLPYVGVLHIDNYLDGLS